jgi:putative restriction endonuclease
MDQPFFYLGTQRFWTPCTSAGERATVLEHATKIDLAPDFWKLLHDATFRAEATHILITTWFPDSEQVALFSTFGFTKQQIKRLNLDLNATRTNGEIVQGRDARFRIMVVSQYRFTCALTGYGLHTVKGSSLVEAAHIHAFADSKDNSIGNGLALTRDAHWMFDEGLWTLSETSRVCVAKEVFTEWGPDGYWLKERDGCELIFEKGVTLRPSPEHCAWHRGMRFKGK